MTVQDTRTPPAARPAGGDPTRSRRPLVLGVVATLLAAALAVVLVGVTRGGPEATGTTPPQAATPEAPGPDATAPSAPASAPSAPPADPAAPPVAADDLPPALPAVGLDEAVAVEQVTASVASVEAVDGQGSGRGAVNGPALVVTVRLENGSSAALDLAGVSVNLTHGAARTPASPLEDPRRAPFTGTLAPGGSAEGAYVFSVPVQDRGVVAVEVAPRAGAPIAVLSGPVG